MSAWTCAVERLDARELHLRPDAVEEVERQRAVVEIAREVEQVGLDPVLCLPEGRPVPDVDDRLGVAGRPSAARAA